jgi:hypothetical protein
MSNTKNTRKNFEGAVRRQTEACLSDNSESATVLGQRMWLMLTDEGLGCQTTHKRETSLEEDK